MLNLRGFLIFTLVLTSTALANPAAPKECKVSVPSASDLTQVQASDAKPGEAAIAEDPQPGVVTFIDQPLAGELNPSMLTLIRMMVPTRATGFSYKDMQGKDQGKIVLGVELNSKYTLELEYASDFRKTDRFVLDKILIVSPNGKDEDLSKAPLKTNGNLRAQAEINPQDFPDLAGVQFHLEIFSQIDAPIIKELQEIGPRLELLDKDELRAVAQVKNYRTLKSFLRYKSAQKHLKKYVTQGPFKQAYSLTLGTALSFGFAYAISLAMPDKVKDVIDSIDPHKHKVTLSDGRMPKAVRKELKGLESSIDKDGVVQFDRAHYPALLTYLEVKDSQSDRKALGDK